MLLGRQEPARRLGKKGDSIPSPGLGGPKRPQPEAISFGGPAQGLAPLLKRGGP